MLLLLFHAQRVLTLKTALKEILSALHANQALSRLWPIRQSAWLALPAPTRHLSDPPSALLVLLVPPLHLSDPSSARLVLLVPLPKWQALLNVKSAQPEASQPPEPQNVQSAMLQLTQLGDPIPVLRAPEVQCLRLDQRVKTRVLQKKSVAT